MLDGPKSANLICMLTLRGSSVPNFLRESSENLTLLEPDFVY